MNLFNAEFGGITTKEVDAGNYLDTVSQQSLNKDCDDHLSIGQVLTAARIEHDSLINDQN